MADDYRRFRDPWLLLVAIVYGMVSVPYGVEP
jgi:hypothetical protein